jgi:hypothetical protein
MSTWNRRIMFLGSGVRQVRRPSVSWLSRQCEIINTSQPYRHPRPFTGIALFTSSATVSKHTPSTGPHTTCLEGRFYITSELYIRAKSTKRSGKTATKHNTQVYTCLSSTEANINTDSEHCNTDWNTPLTYSVALVRKRTIPIERQPLVGEVGANFFG